FRSNVGRRSAMAEASTRRTTLLWLLRVRRRLHDQPATRLAVVGRQASAADTHLLPLPCIHRANPEALRHAKWHGSAAIGGFALPLSSVPGNPGPQCP